VRYVEVETTAKENIANSNEPLQHGGLLPVGNSANQKYQAVYMLQLLGIQRKRMWSLQMLLEDHLIQEWLKLLWLVIYAINLTNAWRMLQRAVIMHGSKLALYQNQLPF
jgi:hypothetical protein